jgi:hypothetical protein
MTKNLGYFSIWKNCPKKQSPNRRKIAPSGHLDWSQVELVAVNPMLYLCVGRKPFMKPVVYTMIIFGDFDKFSAKKLAILTNFRRKKWRFGQKPTITIKLYILE